MRYALLLVVILDRLAPRLAALQARREGQGVLGKPAVTGPPRTRPGNETGYLDRRHSGLDTPSAHDLWCSGDGEAQGLLPAPRRSTRRQRCGDQAGVPPPGQEATILTGARDGCRGLPGAADGLRDARRRREPPALRRGPAQSEREPLAARSSWSFAARPAARDLRRPIQPASLSGEILLSAREAAAGGVLPLDVPAARPPARPATGPADSCSTATGATATGKVQRRLPVPLRIPPGVRDGTVFQVSLDEPAVLSVLLTVHIRAI